MGDVREGCHLGTIQDVKQLLLGPPLIVQILIIDKCGVLHEYQPLWSDPFKSGKRLATGNLIMFD